MMGIIVLNEVKVDINIGRKRKTGIAIIVLLICLIGAGSVAEDQPKKRVMNFLAVMDLKCGKVVPQGNCTALTDVVIEELVKIKKYTIIDRANRDKILGEMGFQMTGCMDESCVGIAAALHAALASPATRYLDLDGHLDLARDPVTGGFVLQDGDLSVTDAPGLGVEMMTDD